MTEFPPARAFDPWDATRSEPAVAAGPAEVGRTPVNDEDEHRQKETPRATEAPAPST